MPMVVPGGEALFLERGTPVGSYLKLLSQAADELFLPSILNQFVPGHCEFVPRHYYSAPGS